MIFEQTCENTTARKAINKDKGPGIKVDLMPTFCEKSQLIKSAQKSKKKPTF